MLDNLSILQNELQWLQRLYYYYFIGESSELSKSSSSLLAEGRFDSIDEIPVPDIDSEQSTYSLFVKLHNLNVEERLLLITALAVQWDLEFFRVSLPHGYEAFLKRMNSKMGLIPSQFNDGLIPSGYTFVTLNSRLDLQTRLHSMSMISPHSKLFKMGVISLGQVPQGESIYSGPLMLAPDFIRFLLSDAFLVDAASSFLPKA